MARHDLAGRVFGRWAVLERAAGRITPGGTRKTYWSCRCSCGTDSEVRTEHLVNGRTQSCGCHKSEAAAEQKTRHGGRDRLLYDVWTQMRQRCENPKNKGFRRYGARGISVCEAWRDFAVFQQWADEHCYQPGLTIDRRDNDGNYEPGNCRWVKNVENCRNTPRVVSVEWAGKSVPLNALAEQHGQKAHTVYARFKIKGWTLRQSLGLDEPPKKVRPPISDATRERMAAARRAFWERKKS